MTIAVTNIGTAVQSGSAGGTLSVTVGVGGVPAGSTIIVVTQETGTQASPATPTDTASNAYSTATSGNPNGSSTSGAGGIFYSNNVLALVSTNTIRIALTSTHNGAITAMYATGLATSNPLDSAVTATGTGSATTIGAVTSGTPTVTGELFVATLNWRNTVTATQDSGNGWAAPPNAATQTTAPSGSILAGSQVNAGTGTKTWQPTVSGSAIYWAAIVGFLPFSPLTSKPWFEQPEIRPQYRRDVEAKGFQPLPAFVAPAAIPRAPSQIDAGFLARRWLEPQSSPIIPGQVNFTRDRSLDPGFLARRSVEPQSAPIVAKAKTFVFSQDAVAAPSPRRAVDAPSFIARAPAIIIRPSQDEILYRTLRALTDLGFVPSQKLTFKQPSGDESTLWRPAGEHLELYTPSIIAPPQSPALDVFVKDWRKKRRRDPIDFELEEKAKRRAALELAIYGPESAISDQISPEKPLIHRLEPDVADLTKVVLAARQAHFDSIRAQLSASEEDDLEAILREIL